MKNKKILITSLSLIFLISFFHFLSISNSWYWTYRWLDIPVHIVGGFWVALTFLWVLLYVNFSDDIKKHKKKMFLLMMSSVLFTSIIWEVSELFLGITYVEASVYFEDTITDIFSGMFGGYIAFLFFIKNKNSKKAKIDCEPILITDIKNEK
jgi:hypothetical protein